jgi:hypothetical protein
LQCAGESPATRKISLESPAILRRGGIEHGKKAARREVVLAIPAVMPAIFACLEHDPEKWEPVFRKDHAQKRDEIMM